MKTNTAQNPRQRQHTGPINFLPLYLFIVCAMAGCSRTAMLTKDGAAADGHKVSATSTDTGDAGRDGVSADANADRAADASTNADAAGDGHADSEADSEVDADAGADAHPDVRPDSGRDTGTDIKRDTGPDINPVCNCNVRQHCNASTGTCNCIDGYAGDGCSNCDGKAGYVEWPAGSGTCIKDPCIGVTCGGMGTCSIGKSGLAVCDCPDGWTGRKCNQQWQTIQVPPFVMDVAFDSDGNGWFVTSVGLLYWDFNGTPGDTSDDSWMLGAPPEKPRGIAVDSMGGKWVVSDRKIFALDDNKTPHDISDDRWDTFPASVDSYDEIKRFRLDSKNRIWLIAESGLGVRVLRDTALLDQTDPPWITLFNGEKVIDIAAEESGVWLATESGLRYVDLGGSLSDDSDDRSVDFSTAPALHGRHVEAITIDAKGIKWFGTNAGTVRLDDGGNPFDDTKHAWTAWAPEGSGKNVNAGPIVAIAADGAKWLKSTWGSALRVEEPSTGNEKWTEYSPRTCPVFEGLDFPSSISAIALDEREHKWLSSDGDLYYFEDRGTPMELSDDLWVFAGRPEHDQSIVTIVPDPDGGLWIKTVGPVYGPLSCNSRIYYFHLGDPANAFDDVWEEYSLANWAGDCKGLYGVDTQGRPWFKSSSPNGGFGPYFVLEDRKTPLDPSDDVWGSWSSEEKSFLGSRLGGFDPTGGVWFGAVHFDYGNSLADKTDDRWIEVDSFVPGTVAVDASGSRWFGYVTNNYDNPGIGGTVRYFNDGGTLSDVSDDIWIDFSTADGLPFEDVYDIRIDGLGEKWIAGYDSNGEPQLCSLNDNGTPTDKSDDEWTMYPTKDGLANPDVSSFAIDKNSDLWIATETGMSYLHVER